MGIEQDISSRLTSECKGFMYNHHHAFCRQSVRKLGMNPSGTTGMCFCVGVDVRGTMMRVNQAADSDYDDNSIHDLLNT